MRLVFVSHSFSAPDRPLSNVGGMQRVAMELDAAIRRRTDARDGSLEYDAILLVADWKWVHILALPFLFRTYFRLRGLIKRGDVDVILFSSMVTAALTIPLRRHLNKSAVRTASIVHGQDVTKPIAMHQNWVVPKVFSAIDLIMPVSGATGDACVARGLPPGKLVVVHNGVELGRFPAPSRPAGARESASSRSQLAPGSFLMCSIGRQVKRKGFAWFIENVMPELDPRFHYWLGGDGPEGAAIAAAIERAGLQDRVRLLGRLGDEELRELYQSADLFVMPNIPVPGDMEGFGIVMLEAGLCGLPTVAAALEGILEVIVEGQNGYFVGTTDAQEYVSRIRTLEAERDGPGGLSALSARTREHVIEHHGWDAVAENYLSALRRHRI